jgi:hypothetical protein
MARMFIPGRCDDEPSILCLVWEGCLAAADVAGVAGVAEVAVSPGVMAFFDAAGHEARTGLRIGITGFVQGRLTVHCPGMNKVNGVFASSAKDVAWRIKPDVASEFHTKAHRVRR